MIAALGGVLTGNAFGGELPEMGARSLGRGGVGVADGTDAVGEEINLAAASLETRYQVYAGGELGPDGRMLARSGAFDSRTSAVALGAGYRWMIDDVLPGAEDLPGWKGAGETLTNVGTHQRVHLGIAVPFLDRRMSVAAHTRYEWRTTELGGDDNAFDFGLSVAGRPIPTLTIALAGRNLLDPGYDRASRMADLGLRFAPGPYLGVEADVSAPLDATFGVDTFQWRAGLDVSVVQWLALRGGWSMEEGTNSASAGVALLSEKASLDYGIKVRLDAPERNWHAVDLRVEF